MSFYDARDILRQDMIRQGEIDKDEELGFDFLENEFFSKRNGELCKLNNKELSANDFLHGYCDVFAYYLHLKYNYRIVNIFDDEGGLIHSFCVDKKGFLVDVRGKTKDIEVFFEPYSDWITTNQLYEYDTNDKCLVGDYQTKDLILLLDAAMTADECHHSYYKD